MLLPAIVLFIIGTAFGSFLSVLIYRIRHNKKGIFFGKSVCPSCGKKLKARDLIPVVSYLVGKGKCRHCKKKINKSYLFLELFTGFIFVALYVKFDFYHFGDPLKPLLCPETLAYYIYFTALSILLIGIFVYDLLYYEIPEIFTFTAIGIAFLGSFLTPEPGFYSMAIGGAALGLFFAIQVWISKETWVGKGDVQVGILMGMLLGWQLGILALVLTYIIGSLVTLPLLISKKLSRKSQVPFAPFMVTATFVTIFFGEYLLNLYLHTLI